MISTAAEACPGCGAKRKKPSGCLTIIVGFVLLVIVLAVIGQCSEKVSGGKATSSPAAAAPAAGTSPKAEEPPKPGAQWRYSSSNDEMTGKPARQASVLSTNSVTFDFPYQGAQHGQLSLRTHPRHGKDVILSIERGQFQCRSYDGCTVLVRFDDGAPQKFSATGASDNSTETLFIQNYSRFVGAMAKAKTIRISAEVFQQGNPVFEFDVAGFDQAKYLGQQGKANE